MKVQTSSGMLVCWSHYTARSVPRLARVLWTCYGSEQQAPQAQDVLELKIAVDIQCMYSLIVTNVQQ